MDELTTFIKSAIGIAFFICSWLVARALLLPLTERMHKWLVRREVTPEEKERAREAYPLTEKELEKIAFDERVKVEAAKEEIENASKKDYKPNNDD